MAEGFTIPIGKTDWIWATHDRPDSGVPAGRKNPPAIVIMIHGFPGNSASFGNVFGSLSDTLIRDGFHTLRFDMRGCGNSDRGAKFFSLKTAHEDALVAIRWAIKQGYTDIVLAAEGFGATIALTALIDTVRPSVRGLLFLWPLLERRQSWLSNLIPLGEKAENAGLDHIELAGTAISLGFIHEIRDYNLLPLMRRMTMPVAIHHCTSDPHDPMGALKG